MYAVSAPTYMSRMRVARDDVSVESVASFQILNGFFRQKSHHVSSIDYEIFNPVFLDEEGG